MHLVEDKTSLLNQEVNSSDDQTWCYGSELSQWHDTLMSTNMNLQSKRNLLEFCVHVVLSVIIIVIIIIIDSGGQKAH